MPELETTRRVAALALRVLLRLSNRCEGGLLRVGALLARGRPRLRETELKIYVLALSLAVSSSACVSSIINSHLEEEVAATDAQQPSIEVLFPRELAAVRRVAVLPFENDAWHTKEPLEVYRGDSHMKGRVFSSHTEVGKLLAERFEESLLKAHVLEVVERSRLASVLNEQALQQKLSPSKYPEMVAAGAGADAVLLGTVTMDMTYLPDDPEILSLGMFAVHMRLVDTHTGRILLFGRDTLGMTASIVNDEVIVSRLSERLAKNLSDVVAELRTGTHDEKRAPPSAADAKSPGDVAGRPKPYTKSP